MFGLFGTTAMWAGLAVLLVATVFVRNLYCRFLVPRRGARDHLAGDDGLQDQALVRVQQLQDLREELRVGAIRGPLIVKSEWSGATTASGSTWPEEVPHG